MPFPLVLRGHPRSRALLQSLLAAAVLGCAWPLAAGGLGAAAPPSTHSANSRARKPVLKATPYEQAKRLRDQLEDVPEQDRTRASYTTVMDAFRAIYHDHPRDSKADDSIYMVAQLLAEQGRLLRDKRSSQAAVGQYEFLRRQYPLTPFRIDALLAEGQIEQNDLHDAAAAQGMFADLLARYPHSPQAGEASTALASLESVEPGTSSGAAALRTAAPGTATLGTATLGTVAQGSAASRTPGHPAAQPVLTPGASAASQPSASRAGQYVASEAQTAATTEVAASGIPAANARVQPIASRSGAIAQVTSIRHWSTSTYTRVVIQLGDEVKYEAGRVPNPDRIYFDLQNTHLAHELMGRNYDVTDDGYLRRIRAAQFSNNVTRIVLDVSDVTEYSAFILPNPYRLIIDIHGKAPASIPGIAASPAAAPANSASSSLPSGAATENTGPQNALPHAAAIDANAAVSTGSLSTAQAATHSATRSATRPATRLATRATDTQSVNVPSGSSRPAANSVAANAAPARNSGASTQTTGYSRPSDDVLTSTTNDVAGSTTNDVATLTQQNDHVTATRRPTSQPIAATVKQPTRRQSAVAGPSVAVPVTTAALDQPEVPVAGASPALAATGSPRTTKPGRSKNNKKSARADDASPAHAAELTSTAGSSLVRALGLKIGRIVIDAGHGGHDSGTLGPDGIEEKDVVLDVALRLGNLLRQRLGAEVIYTRDDDTFVPLETRTAIANKAQADLFISIHANSSSEPKVRGVETYYLNFTSQPGALEVAARENAVSNQSIYQLSDLVKKITLKDKLDESREFAYDVDTSLYAGLQKGNEGLKNRGVKKAPFVVLIGANMPSILAEISFVTNPKDARLMRDPSYNQRIAESLYRGIAKYVEGLSGVRVAQIPGQQIPDQAAAPQFRSR